MITCGIDRCQNPPKNLSQKWCAMHYLRLQRNGHPLFYKATASKPKKCVYCHKSFRSLRHTSALTCSARCNLRRWRQNNPEHNNRIKNSWRRKNGVLERGSLEHRRQQAEKSRGNKNRWKGGYQNHLMHNRNRRIMKLKALGFHSLEEWQELKEKF